MNRKVQVWIFSKETNPQCLLLQTNAARGAFWQPVTGSVESHESGEEGFLQAARRETREETGLELEPINTGYQFEFDSRFGPATERVFAAGVDTKQPPTLDPKEHQDYRWVKATEAAPLLKFPANVEGLKRSFHCLFGRSLALLAAFMFFMTSQLALAAQDARVVQADSPIHERPDSESAILERRQSGDKLRISSETRAGWFKTRTAGGQLGWIEQKNVAPEGYKGVFESANLDRTPRASARNRNRGIPQRFALRLAAGPALTTPLGVNQVLGKSQYRIHRGTSLLGQLGVYIVPDLKAVIRLERLTTNKRKIDSYEVSLSSIPVHGGVEYDIARVGRWRFGIGGFAGLGLGHEVTFLYLDSTDGTTREAKASGTTLSGMGTLYSQFSPFSWLAITGELGYRYSRGMSNVTASFNTGEQLAPFFENGEAKSFRLSEAGPIINIGVEFRF